MFLNELSLPKNKLAIAMPYSRDEVFRLIEESQDSLRDLGVQQLQLFGSTARNEATLLSDLDFVVELKRITFGAYMDVKLLLEDLFHCPVDLVLSDAIKPRLRDRILQEAVHAPGF